VTGNRRLISEYGNEYRRDVRRKKNSARQNLRGRQSWVLLGEEKRQQAGIPEERAL
jgi:hypothetical protein